MKLVLGVLDVAYSDAESTPGQTTGDVAEILEERYHVMETFFGLRKDKIAETLAESMANSINSVINGGPAIDPSKTLTYEGDQKIEASFRAFLSADEMSQLAAKYGLTLSAAATAGVNHRKKNSTSKKNQARPAFVDTGLYMASFRAWTES